MSLKKAISKSDILDDKEYTMVRKEKRKEQIQLKKNRRLAIGPNATFYFENFSTMLAQVQEMLFIEKGGDEQLIDELEAYNPLIPQGNDIVATFMFEVANKEIREKFLSELGGVEKTIYFSIDNQDIRARPETEVERTDEFGKTSSIHFLHFDLNVNQKKLFKGGKEAAFKITHKKYSHQATIPQNVKDELIKDLD